MSWRDRARPIIARVLQEYAGASERDIRKALREAYPFGPREHWPYKVWCDEVAEQRGTAARKERKAKHDAGQLYFTIGDGDIFGDQLRPTPPEPEIDPEP
jgi:hypothetical protein